MKSFDPDGNDSPKTPGQSSRFIWFFVIGAVLVALLAVLLSRRKAASLARENAANASLTAANRRSEKLFEKASRRPRENSARGLKPGETPEEIVAQKVRQFGQNRRAIARSIASRLNQEVPPEIEAFFNAVEEGNWDEINSRWKELATHTHQYEHSKSDRPDLEPYWSTVLDAYGVAEQAHDWPAQKLLDYGNAVLDSLRPGMVYVGGTDNGRWVPELLNETSDDPHVIVTQNALADSTYLDYVRELYGDRFNTLSKEDSQRAFQEYAADAQRRFEHDQQFPDEPKQLLPGEKMQMIDGRVQVSGQVAVMAINERILQMLMQKNPDLSFALQESFPLRGTYADAVPLGPLMELGVKDAQNVFTADRAAQSVDYWRAAAQLVLGDPVAAGSDTTIRAYSHDINTAANLLASHGFNSEAEETYRLATQLWPGNAEAAGGLATILSRTGRADEARRLLDDFARNHPDQLKAIEAFRGTITFSAKVSP